MAKVSIIIPCYNDGNLLVGAVRAAQEQVGTDVDVVIVDDHSTDEQTLTVLETLRAEGCTVVRTPEGKKGVSAARNAGIAAASAEYLLPLDADDLIAPAYAAKAAKVLDEHPDVRVCYCNALYFGELRKKWKLPQYHYDDLLFDNSIFCTALFRRDDWLAVGGYDENLTLGLEDWAFWLAILARGGRAHKLDEPLFRCRVRPGSRTAQMKSRGEEEAVRAVFDSQRTIYEQNAWLMFKRIRELQTRLSIQRLLAFRMFLPLFLAEAWLRGVLSASWARLMGALGRRRA